MSSITIVNYHTAGLRDYQVWDLSVDRGPRSMVHHTVLQFSCVGGGRLDYCKSLR